LGRAARRIREFVMLPALGAASAALDVLQSLTAKKASAKPTTGVTQNAKTAFDPAALTADSTTSTSPSGSSSTSGRLSPDTMNALLAAQSQSSDGSATSTSTSRSDALKDLFKLLDGDGDGKISKAEFEDKLGAGGTNVSNADSVFDKLDKDGDGSVSLNELMSALKGKGHHHHKPAGSDSANNATSADGATDPLLQALQGASSTSTTNSDGTTTTSLSYADGSKVSMTSAPGGTSSSGAVTSSYNFIEQLIQRQAQAISASATSSLSVSV
jgi:Ca2+-binding EF-hand superfamily protein